jgi:hypothetical protein
VAADAKKCIVAVTAEGGPTRVLALHMDSGRDLWSVAVDDFDAPAAVGVWAPTLTHGLLVINTSHGVAALRAEDGRLAWRSEANGAKTVYGTRVLMSGMSLAAPGQPSEIVVLDVLSGREVWRRAYPEVLKKSRANRLTGYLAVSESHIFAGDGAGGVWAFDARSGDPVWYHRAKGSDAFSPWTLPVVAGGRLYLTTAGDRPQILCYGEGRGRAPEESVTEPEEARLGFAIERAYTRQRITRSKPYFEKGGSWTILRCVLDEGGTFFLAVDEYSAEGRLWVDGVEAGERVLKAIRKAFPVRGAKAPSRGTRTAGPVTLDVVLLGSGVEESGQGKGTWTISKWTGEDGVPEFFVNWSLAEKRGSMVEKDEGYRKDLTRLAARLLVR